MIHAKSKLLKSDNLYMLTRMSLLFSCSCYFFNLTSCLLLGAFFSLEIGLKLDGYLVWKKPLICFFPLHLLLWSSFSQRRGYYGSQWSVFCIFQNKECLIEFYMKAKELIKFCHVMFYSQILRVLVPQHEACLTRNFLNGRLSLIVRGRETKCCSWERDMEQIVLQEKL